MHYVIKQTKSKEVMIDPKSNPLFTPVPVMAGMTPLEDCVLSFSQCAGAEKDSLTFLANRLGARYVVFSVYLLSWCTFYLF